jgi:hypothetical protein
MNLHAVEEFVAESPLHVFGETSVEEDASAKSAWRTVRLNVMYERTEVKEHEPVAGTTSSTRRGWLPVIL